MSPIYDFICPQCQEVEEIFCHSSMIGCFTCHKCDVKLEVKPAAANFTIEGFKSQKGDRKNFE